jgi:hypothetical protein
MRREGRGTFQGPQVLKLQISSRTSVPLHKKPDTVGRNILAAIPVVFYEITDVDCVYSSNTTFIGRIESIFYIR